MKSTKFIVTAIVFALLFGISTNDLFSQKRGQRGGKGNATKMQNCQKNQQRDSTCKNIQANVLPELQTLKADFDKSLSTNDLDKLNSLRSEAAALRESAKLHSSERRNLRKSNISQEEKAAFRESRDAHRDKMIAIFDEVKAIADKNSGLVSKLSNDLQKIADENDGMMMFSGNKQMMNKRSNRSNKMHCDSSNMPMKRQFKIDRTMTERFMLWDGSSRVLANDGIHQDLMSSQLSNFPNPFSDKTSIKIVLPKKETATINIYDNSGNHLGEIFKGTLNAGENVIDFNASSIKGLIPGVLVYKVKTETLNLSGKMVYSK